ncbi:hypothetical protein [Massilia sp. BKSP1R2A-1]|uniref:hypothetical protein n=1 Tax=Massilia sp. BKSP1R2A-1 TaxID=3422595 RepID=UPI003D333BBD
MIRTSQIGSALVAALGLPKQTSAFTLHARAGQIVTVECEYAPESDLFATELARYGLVALDSPRKPAAHPADAMGYDAWEAQRKELAHREFMHRTNRLP